MSRPLLVTAVLLLCVACDHDLPVQPQSLPPPPPPGNRPPIAQLNGPTTAHEGQHLPFTAVGSLDPEGGPLTLFWDFGNGNFVENSSQRTIPVGFSDNGLYTVRLVARDNSGATDTASVAVTVTNSPPELVGISPPAQQAVHVQASTRIAFSDSGFKDTHTFTIHWGDGSSETLTGESPPWAQQSVRHSYAEPGKYWVTAVVQDDDGGKDSAMAQAAVIVFDPAEHQTVAGYDVLDLGTLGGNDARPTDINDRGQVVGTSLTQAGTTSAFMWDGVLHDLGTLGYQNSRAAVINDAGVVAGELWTETDDYYPRPTVAAAWDGAWRILAGTQPRPPVFINLLDEAGMIAVSEFRWESAAGWLWRNGDWRALDDLMPTVGGSESYPMATNARGQVVGMAPYRLYGTGRLNHATLWTDNSVHDLGVLAPHPCGDEPGDCSRAKATSINDAGQIVGLSTDATGNVHFVGWEDGKIFDLGPTRVMYVVSSLHAFINARGQIAGSAGGEAFYWSSTGASRTTIPTGAYTDIIGLNDDGEVAGTFVTGSGEQHVFIWSESRGLMDLGGGPHGFTAAWAVGMNARGDIIGFAAPCVPNPHNQNRCGDPEEARPVLWRRVEVSPNR